MSHLTDQEELIASIYQLKTADYMREAMSCYTAGAYRGCIVLSCIALFDDLVDKLAELARVDSDAKKIHTEVVKRREDQNVYESYLLDQLKAKRIIPELTATILGSIRDKRNRSAHPSGHSPTAEEARYVFSEVIQLVLSKPKLTTTLGVDLLLKRLSNANLFPTNYIGDIEDIVKEEISIFHPRSFPYLVSKLVELYSGTKTGTSKTSASYFLVGLSKVNDSDLNPILFNKFIKTNIEDTNNSDTICRCLAVNPGLYQLFDSNTARRFKAILIKLHSSGPSLPSNVLKALFNQLSSEEFKDNFMDLMLEFLDKEPYNPGIYFAFNILDNSVIEKHKKKLIENAGSSTYNIANDFARNFDRIESKLIDQISDKESFLIIIGIIGAAKNGANGSTTLYSNDFNSIPRVKEKAKKYASEHRDDAKDLCRENRVTLDIDDFVA